MTSRCDFVVGPGVRPRPQRMDRAVSPPLMTPTQSGLDQLSLTALLCGAFAGLAVFLLLRHPAGQLRRMTRRRSRLAVAVAPMLRLLRGRTDAPPLIRRVLLSMVGILALGLAAARIDGWLGAALVRSAGSRRDRSAGTWLARASGSSLPSRTVDHGSSAGVGADGCAPRRRSAGPHGVCCGCANIRRACRGRSWSSIGVAELGAGDVVAWKALHDHPQLGLAAAGTLGGVGNLNGARFAASRSRGSPGTTERAAGAGSGGRRTEDQILIHRRRESGSDSSLSYKTGTRPSNKICGRPSQDDQLGVRLTT